MAIRNRSIQRIYRRRSVSASGVPELIPSNNRCYFPRTTTTWLWVSVSIAGTVLLLSLVYDGGFFINDMLRRDLLEGTADDAAAFAADTESSSSSGSQNSSGRQNMPLSTAATAVVVAAGLVPKSRQASCRLLRNHMDVDHCYPLGSVKKFHDPECATIDSWATVNRCLFGRYEYDNDVVGGAAPISNNTTSNVISFVHILGERHSGTKFITQQVQDCFPKEVNGSFKIHRDFLRSKHFFQPIFWTEDYRQRMVIVVVRDPYEWVAAMRERPYHAPDHAQQLMANGTVVPLPWSQFVTRRWTTQHSVIDEALWRQADRDSLRQYVCRARFRLNQVMPCQLDYVTAQSPPWNIPPRLWRGFDPVYEHGRDGKPYQTILDLRRDKVVNWILQIPLVLRVGAFLVVRYEDVLEKGTGFLMDQIAAMTGRPKSDTCQPAPAQPERRDRRDIPDDFRKWIRDNLNPETERLIGYV
jgi:hypothetical protein